MCCFLVTYFSSGWHSWALKVQLWDDLQSVQQARGSAGMAAAGQRGGLWAISRFYLSPLRTWAMACRTHARAHTRTQQASQTAKRGNSCLWQGTYFIQQTAGLREHTQTCTNTHTQAHTILMKHCNTVQYLVQTIKIRLGMFLNEVLQQIFTCPC